ncbi:carboxylesterase family protein [Beauveria brongniartii RCEF 3172]|uniref:Carboxylic ester hydrolase n=1 Tax=Beauveria brongniartii RCEF 3172 TaxID=1081107 RepID=A0A162K3B2_9HYPO|nr:carboxylesterase family protein [Beauveria brongniartii RCEF 3172]
MKLSLLLYSILAITSTRALVQRATLQDPIASTRQGLVQGTRVHSRVNAFRGIPFAKAPLASLRFMPPQPLDGQALVRDGPVRDATEFGPVCLQFHYRSVMGDALIETSGQSEDCLTLNIFVPSSVACSAGPKPLLPVFVWSFGGAFGEGGASMPLFDPTNFVAENQDIIVAHKKPGSYRLNLFGFPNSPALKAQNLGIRDQRVALEWVRDNIAGFGGNASHIVLGGQSAGADSGNAMLYSHADDAIIQGIALQSGTVQIIGAATENADAEFIRVAAAVGCRDATDRARELRCMRDIDADRLHRAVSNKTLNEFASPAGGSPMVDNEILFTPQEYHVRGREGRFARVPTLLGVTDSEGDSVLNWSVECGVNKTVSAIISASLLNCNVALESQHRHLNNVPTWRYRYMGVFPEVTPYSWLGSYHQADVALLMGTYSTINNTTLHPKSTTAAASRHLQRLFGTFVRDPANGLRKEYGWPVYDPSLKSLMELFRNNTVSAVLQEPALYDEICQNPPPIPWAAVGAAPTC